MLKVRRLRLARAAIKSPIGTETLSFTQSQAYGEVLDPWRYMRCGWTQSARRVGLRG